MASPYSTRPWPRSPQTRTLSGVRGSAVSRTHIPGEMGVRHDDVMFITETGAENMTKWSGTPEDPAVV